MDDQHGGAFGLDALVNNAKRQIAGKEYIKLYVPCYEQKINQRFRNYLFARRDADCPVYAYLTKVIANSKINNAILVNQYVEVLVPINKVILNDLRKTGKTKLAELNQQECFLDNQINTQKFIKSP